MKLIYTILGLILGGYAFGQSATITGKIVSKNSGKSPMEVGFVGIKGSVVGCIPDSSGHYEINGLVQGKKYTIIISAFGYPKMEQTMELHDRITEIDFQIETNCDYDQEKALWDIEQNEIKLLLIGSIVPRGNSKSDNRFERRYRLNYFDFGCMPPAAECVKEYNEAIFSFLDKTYGNAWRKRVRKDVEFLE